METLKLVWLLIRTQADNEYRAWCRGLEEITQRIENWSYGVLHEDEWNAFYDEYGYICDEQKEYIIGTALMTRRGRVDLARSMVEPIREKLSGPPRDIEWEIATAEEMAQREKDLDLSYELAEQASQMAIKAMQVEEDAKVMDQLKKGYMVSRIVPCDYIGLDWNEEVERLRKEQES